MNKIVHYTAIVAVFRRDTKHVHVLRGGVSSQILNRYFGYTGGVLPLISIFLA